MKGIKTTSITNWLIKINMLEYFADENGKNHKIPTENGIQLGITTQERLGMYGSYKVVLYDSNVQQFILDNIDTIAYYNTQRNHIILIRGATYEKSTLANNFIYYLFAGSAVR